MTVRVSRERPGPAALDGGVRPPGRKLGRNLDQDLCWPLGQGLHQQLGSFISNQDPDPHPYPCGLGETRIELPP